MSTQDKVIIRKLPSGVPGLDEILGGGLPEFSFNILAGAPGSGKTTLAHQIMFANATPERPAIYFTVLGEPAIKMLRYQQQYAFFDHAKLNTAIRFINLSQVVLEKDLDAVLAEIVREVEAANPALVLVDSFRTVVRKAQDAASDVELQGFIQRLSLHLASWQATTFLIGEYVEAEIRDNPVFTVADGLFWLSQHVERNSVVRKLQVVKLRGQESVPGLHTVRITEAGLQTFPRTFGLSLKTEKGKSQRRLSTGIAKFDELLHGGIPEGDSLLMAGPSGSGKSVLGTQFIAEGLKHGEPGIVAIFEEMPDQYVRRAATFGFDFTTPQKNGKLELIYLRPLDLSVDGNGARSGQLGQEDRRQAAGHRLAGGLRDGAGTRFPRGLSRVAVSHDRRAHAAGRDDRQHRRDRRGLHFDGPLELRHLVPVRRHRAPALHFAQRPTPPNAAGGQDARRPAQHRHARIPGHRPGHRHRRTLARLPRPHHRHPWAVER